MQNVFYSNGNARAEQIFRLQIRSVLINTPPVAPSPCSRTTQCYHARIQARNILLRSELLQFTRVVHYIVYLCNTKTIQIAIIAFSCATNNGFGFLLLVIVTIITIIVVIYFVFLITFVRHVRKFVRNFSAFDLPQFIFFFQKIARRLTIGLQGVSTNVKIATDSIPFFFL